MTRQHHPAAVAFAFSIALALAAAPAAAQTLGSCADGCGVTPLACGGAVAGTLEEGDCLEDGRPIDVFEWEVTAASDAEIRVTASGFTPRLLVYFPTDTFPCYQAAEGTDACDPGSATVTCARLTTGSLKYLVFVTSAGEAQAGSYTIEAACGALRCDPACSQGSIACDSVVSGNLEAPGTEGGGCAGPGGAVFQSWDLEIAELTRVSLRIASASPIGVSLHHDDPFGGAGCIELARSTPCEGGECLEVVLDPNLFGLPMTPHVVVAGAAAGPFELSIDCEPIDPCLLCPSVGDAAAGTPGSGRIEAGDCDQVFASEFGAGHVRTDRWSLEIATAGLYEIRAEAVDDFVGFNLVRQEGCAFDFPGFPEECPDPGQGSCALWPIEPGQYWLDIQHYFDRGEPPPVDYSFSVSRVDLGACERCLAGSLECGVPAQGSLAEGDCAGDAEALLDVWSFAYDGGPADIAVTVKSQAFAPRLVLLDRLCGELASSDVCEGAEPGTACLKIPSSAVRVNIGVSGSAAEDRGDYTIEVVCVPYSDCAPRCLSGAVAVGQDAVGEMSPGDCTADGFFFTDAWTLRVEEAGLLDIFVRGDGFACSVVPATQDCSGWYGGATRGNVGRVLLDFEPGDYLVLVKSSLPSTGQTGRYDLSVRRRDCGACGTGTALVCGGETRLEGRLEAGDCEDADGFLFDVWTIETDVLRQILIASRGEYHPYIWILEEGCKPRTTYLGNNFSAVGGTLPGGRYTLVVAGFEPGEGGSYTIDFTCNEHDACREECRAGTLECGQTATGVITRDDCGYFTSIFDVWELSVPPLSEATIDISGGANNGSVFYGMFPGSCASFLDLRPLCDFPEGAPDVCRLPAGDYLLYVGSITNVVFQLGDQPYEIRVTTSLCDASGRQLPGDCNQDRLIDLSDAVCLLGALFRGNAARLACGEGELGASGSALLDWDGDAHLALTDAVLVLQYLFDAGPPHVLGLECLPAVDCPDACGG